MTTEIAIITPEERAESEREGAQLVAHAKSLTITTPEKYQEAATWLRELLLPLKRKITETFRPRIRQADALHKGLVADERHFLAPVEEAERIVKSGLEQWDRAERERLRAEQERAAAAAREEAQAAAFMAAEARGDEAAMPAIAAAPAASVAVFTPPPAPAPKAEGVSYRITWTAEVTNLAALVQAVAAGQAPLKVLQADQGVLNGMARALKESLALPGVRAVARRDVAVRA